MACRFSKFAAVVIIISTTTLTAVAQPTPEPIAGDSAGSSDRLEAEFSARSEQENRDEIRLCIQQLSHQNYRTRQMARARLEQYPALAVDEIRQCIQQADTVTGGQLVDLLSGLALHNDLSISRSATQILHSLANQATSLGRSAANSLSAIADLQEEMAVKILSYQGAYIGPQNFSLNGKMDTSIGPLSLRIEDSFEGSQEDIEWIRYLKSVQVVYLRGPKISPEALRAVSQIKGLKAVKLRSVTITPELLLLFQELSALEHLGLSYMDIDDSYVPVIAQLPISQSIRLYGTNVTHQGEQLLGKHFDGLEIFRGSGGFLGISGFLQAQVNEVTAGSAAAEAGIQPGDILVAVAGNQISTFDQLRNELGKFRAGDSVEILLNRPERDRLTGQVVGMLEMKVHPTLKEEGP